MTRRRLLIALLVLVPAGAFAAAHADHPEATFGTNDEQTAAHRWATNQPRHWRQVVVHR